MPVLHFVLDHSGSMSEWHKKQISLSLANSLFFASRGAWPYYSAFGDGFSLWEWKGDDVSPWGRDCPEPGGKASLFALRYWIEKNAASGSDRILLVSDGNLDAHECRKMGEWLQEKTGVKLEAICVGPDGCRENLEFLSSSGLCFGVMDAVLALGALAGEPPSHEGDMAAILEGLMDEEQDPDDDD